MNRLVLPIGILLIIAAGVWYIGLNPGFEQRFPDGWKWEVDTFGTTSWVGEGETDFPEGTTNEDDPLNVTLRTVTASTEDAPDGAVTISDHYLTRDPATNAVTWEYTSTAVVESKTGKYVDEAYADDYYFLPPHAEKITYTVRNSSYQGLPVAFDREEEVSGVNTYVYAYSGDMDNTVSYTDFELEDGQSIVCFDFELTYWVEPATGEIVKYKERCPGDYVVDENGEKVYGISRWAGETTGDDLIRRTDEVKSKLNSYRLKTLYAPLAFLVVGIVLSGAGFATRPKNAPTAE